MATKRHSETWLWAAWARDPLQLRKLLDKAEASEAARHPNPWCVQTIASPGHVQPSPLLQQALGKPYRDHIRQSPGQPMVEADDGKSSS